MSENFEKVVAAVPGLLQRQRTHVLAILCHPKEGLVEEFELWFVGQLRDTMLAMPLIIRGRHFKQHEVDMTGGRHARPEQDYMALYDLLIDAGEQAEPLLRKVAALHLASGVAMPPATWLFYPVCEQVGYPDAGVNMLAVAFTNPIPGMEGAFREFYVTRHLRHVLSIPTLVSGQCFERAQYQHAGSMQPYYQLMSIYDQVAEPEAFMAEHANLPPGRLNFPMLDKSYGRFLECSYRRMC